MLDRHEEEELWREMRRLTEIVDGQLRRIMVRVMIRLKEDIQDMEGSIVLLNKLYLYISVLVCIKN